MEMFAGKITNSSVNCGNDLLNGTEFVDEGYCVLSFNNILISFVVSWGRGLRLEECTDGRIVGQGWNSEEW